MNERPAGTIEGVAGVILTTDRFEEMLRFYRDTLGLPPRHVRDGFVNFEWGGFRLTISTHSEVHGGNLDPARVILNLAVSDIHAAHERLRAAGVEFSRPPARERWGWVATLRDADGNTLQLMQFDD